MIDKDLKELKLAYKLYDQYASEYTTGVFEKLAILTMHRRYEYSFICDKKDQVSSFEFFCKSLLENGLKYNLLNTKDHFSRDDENKVIYKVQIYR